MNMEGGGGGKQYVFSGFSLQHSKLQKSHRANNIEENILSVCGS